MRLTRLQRLGISEVLRDYMYHCDYSLQKGGTISFKNNPRGEFTNMYVDGYNGKKLAFMLMEDENIDDSFTYAFQWNSEDKIFHIIDIENEKGDKINGVS